MSTATSSTLEELAQRIRAGEVVFFVGSGFSIDSEGMTAREIVWRFWIRLEGLCFHAGLGQEGETEWQSFKARFLSGKHSDAKLPATLPKEPSVPPKLEEAVIALAENYYELNDWLCDAYGRLLICCRKKPNHKNLLNTMYLWEADARNAIRGGPKVAPSRIPDQVLEIASDALKHPSISHADQRALGKLALMAAFGFFDEKVLAGRCQGADSKSQETLDRIYGDRLRLRHHVLARLAREGYCPTLITTNFDLLLEGALGLSGLAEERHSESQANAPTESLSVQIPRYDVISDPSGFYQRGKAFRTATLLKIHGCAGRMREEINKEPKTVTARAPYLRQVVYTYREIQNWRLDHWTADLLRTLLRTRALVFAGYSTMDPVVHDTFRSVYEEMERNARENGGGSGGNGAGNSKKKAPAYYLGWSDGDHSVSFHADQVLRSASRAVEHSPEEGSHPHYLRYGKPNSQHLTLDETMGLVAHEVFRAQQMEALKTELAALVARLTGGRRPKEEVRAFLKAFSEFRDQELETVRKAFLMTNGPESTSSDRAEARRVLRRALGWSMGFHPALRREWALALALGQRHENGTFGAAALANQMRQKDWYFPASERPGWTAWSAVLEMALMNMAKALCRDGSFEVEATHDGLPTVTLPYAVTGSVPSRLSLTLQLGGLDRLDKPPTTAGHPSRRVVWTFPEDALPWTPAPRRGSEQMKGTDGKLLRRGLGPVVWQSQPLADWIWKWAIRHFDEAFQGDLMQRFEILPGDTQGAHSKRKTHGN